MLKALQAGLLFCTLLLSALLPSTAHAQGQPPLHWVKIDFRTGKITRGVSSPLQEGNVTSVSGFSGTGSPGQGISPLDFTGPGLFPRALRLDYPYRCVVQIKGENAGSIFHGSGALIGPKHILTAGHVIVDSLGNFNADPKDITLTPTATALVGFDPTPYGSARVITATVADPYFNSLVANPTDRQKEDHVRYDFAVVEIDRPVGFLTQWFGFQSNDGLDYRVQEPSKPGMYLRYNATLVGRPGVNEALLIRAGYPADSFNGEELRITSGDFDYVDDYRAFNHTTTTAEAGDSGAPIWTDDANQFIIALHTGHFDAPKNFYYEDANGNHYDFASLYAPGQAISVFNTGYSEATRLQFGLFTIMRDLSRYSGPATPDLVPLHTRYGTAAGTQTMKDAPKLYAEELLSGLHFSCGNYVASGVGFTGSLNYEVYLSTDDSIDDTDLKVGQGTYTAGILKFRTAVINVAPFRIPGSKGRTLGAPYYLGIKIKNVDSDLTNNFTTGWDAMPIKVLPPRSRVLVSAKVLRVGSLLTVPVTVTNVSTVKAVGVSLTRAMLATNSATGLPVPLGDLEPGQSTTFTLSFPSLPTGTVVPLSVGGVQSGKAFSVSLRVTLP